MDLLGIASAEFLLVKRANSGGLVLARSLIITVLVYGAAVALKAILEPGAILRFDAANLRAVLKDTLPWAGAIFAGIYATLYGRFSSQWLYLANLYNQLMATQAQAPDYDYSTWKAGFIEDAEELHLSLKPMYAAIIADMLKDDTIRERYEADVPNGGERLKRLERNIARVLKRVPVAGIEQPPAVQA